MESFYNSIGGWISLSKLETLHTYKVFKDTINTRFLSINNENDKSFGLSISDPKFLDYLNYSRVLLEHASSRIFNVLSRGSGYVMILILYISDSK